MSDKEIQDSLGLSIPSYRFLTPGTGFPILVSETWIPDSNRYQDSEFLELFPDTTESQDSRFTRKHFWIPGSTGKNFRDSGVRISLRGGKEISSVLSQQVLNEVVDSKDSSMHCYYNNNMHHSRTSTTHPAESREIFLPTIVCTLTS